MDHQETLESVNATFTNAKNWLTSKDPDAEKDWRQEEKGTTEDEMIGWLHRLDEHEFEQAPGVGDGRESLACCSPWGHKESDMIEQMMQLMQSIFPVRKHFWWESLRKWVSWDVLSNQFLWWLE